MNILESIKQKLAVRAAARAERIAEYKKKEQDRLEALLFECIRRGKEVTAELVKVGYIVLDTMSGSEESEWSHATMWAIGPDKQTYKVIVSRKGGVNITLVK